MTRKFHPKKYNHYSHGSRTKPNSPANKSKPNFGSSSGPGIAAAPYNFVPLNEKVVPAEEDFRSEKNKDRSIGISFDKYHEGRFTGYIQLDIETLTPLYIRDTLNSVESRNKKKFVQQKDHKYINPDFFSPAGRFRIPGSSLRGMIRTLVEILSYGKFLTDGEKKFHFRSFADRSLALRANYSSRMITKINGGYTQKVKAGYLFRKGFRYYILPAQSLSPGIQYFRVEEDMAIKKGVLDKSMSIVTPRGYRANNNYEPGYMRVSFTYNHPTTQGIPKHSVPLYYAEVKDICKAETQLDNSFEGYLICSGWIGGPPGRPRGKHMHWIIGPRETDESLAIQVPLDVIENYIHDKTRDDRIDILKDVKPNGPKVPCFYIEENGRISSFGHTGLFRLAYTKNIKEHIPPQHLAFIKNKKIDIPEAIFGNENKFPSRVFFEDFECMNDLAEKVDEIIIPKILSTPKPTTFQHYLEQNRSQGAEDRFNRIEDYDGNSFLRGYKLYWHKSNNPSNWIAEEILFSRKKFDDFLFSKHIEKRIFNSSLSEDGPAKYKVKMALLPPQAKSLILEMIGTVDTQHTKIKVIDKGTSFSGKIRFENLSRVELGALLSALKLPDGCHHKLGMGKPLGLGSIKIKLNLFLSDRRRRYKDIFAEWESLKESEKENKTIEDLKNDFAKYVLKELGNPSSVSLWELDRMKELKRLLAFEEGPSPNKRPADKQLKYIENLKEFKERKILPKATDV